MRIVWHEIRKIWNLKILLVLLVFCGLFYSMNMMWHVEWFHDPLPGTERTNWAEQLRERYGYSITEEEMEAFLAETWPVVLAEADEHIRRLPIFAERGLTSYLEFRQMQFDIWAAQDWDELWEADADSEWESQASFVIAFEEADFIGGVLDSLEGVQTNWDRRMHEWDRDISRDLRAWSEVFYQGALEAVEQGRLAAFLAEQRAVMEAEVDRLIAASPAFAAIGVTNYEEFRAYWQTPLPEPAEHRVQWNLWASLFGPEHDYIFDKLYNRVEAVEHWVLGQLPEDMHAAGIRELMERDMTAPTAFEYRRLREITETGEIANIMSFRTYNAVEHYFTQLVLMICFAVLILITPLLATDRMRNIHSLQYSAKLGRRLMYRQLAAVMISAFALAAILVAVFTGIFATTGQFVWWNHSVVSFLQWVITLFPMTLGQFILVILLMGLLLGLMTAGIAFLISRFSRNVMMALFKAIPVFVALSFLQRPLFGTFDTERPLTFFNPLYRLTRIVGIELIVCVLLLGLALAAALWVSRREKRVDVV